MQNHILAIVATVLAFQGRAGAELESDQEDTTRAVRSVQSWQPGQDPYHGPYQETGYGEYSWDYLTPDYAKYWWPNRRPPQPPPSNNPPPAQGRSSFFEEDDFEDFEDSFDSEDFSDAPKRGGRKKPSRKLRRRPKPGGRRGKSKRQRGGPSEAKCEDIDGKTVKPDCSCNTCSTDQWRCLGCNAGGQNQECRFCGFDNFPDCDKITNSGC